MISTTATATRTLSGPQVLRPKQVLALLRAPDKRTRLGRRDAALLACLATGGLRLGEATRLVVGDIELGKRVRISTRTLKTHGQRSRTVTLPAPAAKLLRGWLDYSQPRYWVFPGRRNEALTTRQAGRIVRGYLREIGRGDMRPHGLRHTVGAIVTRQAGLWVAANVLGHASVDTTKRFYSQYCVEDADKAADKLEEAMR